MDLSVVIPAYNEQQRISKTIRKIQEFLDSKNFDYEIIVVDDGSRDNTSTTAQQFKKTKVIRLGKNQGKGNAVKEGILNANKSLVLMTDADLSTPIEELDKLIKEIKNNDIVIASRNLPESKITVKQPFLRSFLGKIFPLLVKIIVLQDFEDTQCGFKLFKTNTAKEVCAKQTIKRFGFDVELLTIAKTKGYEIKEVPVSWENSDKSKVKVWKDVPKMFASLVKIRWNLLRGRYA